MVIEVEVKTRTVRFIIQNPPTFVSAFSIYFVRLNLEQFFVNNLLIFVLPRRQRFFRFSFLSLQIEKPYFRIFQKCFSLIFVSLCLPNV